jgi:hypothetical protein
MIVDSDPSIDAHITEVPVEDVEAHRISVGGSMIVKSNPAIVSSSPTLLKRLLRIMARPRRRLSTSSASASASASAVVSFARRDMERRGGAVTIGYC